MKFVDSYFKYEEERIREYIEEMITTDLTQLEFHYDDFIQDFPFTDREDVTMEEMLEVHLLFMPNIHEIEDEIQKRVMRIAEEIIDEEALRRDEEERENQAMHSEYWRAVL